MNSCLSRRINRTNYICLGKVDGSYAFAQKLLPNVILATMFVCPPAIAQTVLFDFDTAPLHSPLPIDITVSGVTAHLSATGQGFSIQRADTMGFTPIGFSGYCVYPSSVFAADLLVGFSRTMTDFSILYSPQELGCDDSARMRVTAQLNGVSVGTNTATASNPGTWPSETLSISVAGGFNSVVVHYDARPPTCQDWGPIFMADNMNVVLAPVDCSGVNNCSGHGICVATNTCNCDAGWAGPACQTPTCMAVGDCTGHGTCVAPDTCQCDPHWLAPDCSTTDVPALSTWGLLVLALVTLIAGAVIVRKNAARVA